jgi:hypothetical protein
MHEKMTDQPSTTDLLAVVKAKVLALASCGDDEHVKATAKAAVAEALNNLLMLVAKAPKEVMTASVRSDLDTAILGHVEELKWPLLRGLMRCSLYRAYLGLPCTMEQTRKYFTSISANKTKDILEEGLGASLASCEDSLELQWVEEVLVFMTGAGRFKKDLGGFELKGPGKNICKKMINQAKKRRRALDGGIQCVRHGGNCNTGKGAVKIERDFRLDECERQSKSKAQIETIFDQALKLKEQDTSTSTPEEQASADADYSKKYQQHMSNLQQQKETRLKAVQRSSASS